MFTAKFSTLLLGLFFASMRFRFFSCGLGVRSLHCTLLSWLETLAFFGSCPARCASLASIDRYIHGLEGKERCFFGQIAKATVSSASAVCHGLKS